MAAAKRLIQAVKRRHVVIGVRNESDPAGDTGEFVGSEENANRKMAGKARK